MLSHYGGRPDPHSQPGFTHLPPGMGGAFGLSTLREDGFVSLDAAGAEGVVETRPLKLPGEYSALEVNVCPFNTRPGYDPMDVKVDLLSAQREPIASYAIGPAADADTTLRSSPSLRSTSRVWYRIPLDEKLPDTVRLRFRLRNARLYSFRYCSAKHEGRHV